MPSGIRLIALVSQNANCIGRCCRGYTRLSQLKAERDSFIITVDGYNLVKNRAIKHLLLATTCVNGCTLCANVTSYVRAHAVLYALKHLLFWRTAVASAHNNTPLEQAWLARVHNLFKDNFCGKNRNRAFPVTPEKGINPLGNAITARKLI